MGIMDSLFGKKTKTKSEVDPWDQVIPYLTGDSDTPGVFPEAVNLFNANKNDPTINNTLSQFQNLVNSRFSDPGFQRATSVGMDALNGAFDSNLTIPQNTVYRGNVGPIDASSIAAPERVSSVNVQAPKTSLIDARRAQGRLDPTQALGSMLSGQPDNPYLQNQMRVIQQNAARNLNENVMPGLRSEALASGQYGGSRQGIAEGLAMSRLTQDMAPAMTGLMSGAYENAQNRKFGVASDLNNQAAANANMNAERQFNANQFNANMNSDIAKFNAGMGTDVNKFNAGLGTDINKFNAGLNQFNAGMNQGTDQFNTNLHLQNNNQIMNRDAQNLNQRLTGLGMLQQGMGTQDQQFQALLDSQLMPRQLSQDNLNNFANLFMQSAGLGNQSKGKTTSTGGIVPTVLGTMGQLGGLARGFGLLGRGQSGGGG